MILINKNEYIPMTICMLEASLLNNGDLTPYDKASITEDLHDYMHIYELWEEFGNISKGDEHRRNLALV